MNVFIALKGSHFWFLLVLAHLSWRLIGELIVWVGTRRRRLSDNIFKHLSSEVTGPVEAKTYVEYLWVGGTNGHGHMTKMAAIAIYGKHLKNILLKNRMTDDLETWYAASGTRVLPNSFKW